MGQDIINCVCGKDVASIPVPGSEFDVENQPQIIENDPMKQSIMKSEQMKNENNNNFIQIKFNNNSNNNSNQIDNLSNNSLKLKEIITPKINKKFSQIMTKTKVKISIKKSNLLNYQNQTQAKILIITLKISPKK